MSQVSDRAGVITRACVVQIHTKADVAQGAEVQVAEPSNTWSQFMLDIVTAFQASTQRFPNVPVGTGDDYAPPPDAVWPGKSR